ncbi:MAG TPA: hypothetical protein VL307_14215 [Chitinophagaceae bacterium]|nr:hypothetical protein [Chitinophagaceae bacterium]
MKNIFIVSLLAAVSIGFCSFSNNRSVDNEENDITTIDTVPHKKDSSRKKSGTVPYDSFGKPKKMDTTRF